MALVNGNLLKKSRAAGTFGRRFVGPCFLVALVALVAAGQHVATRNSTKTKPAAKDPPKEIAMPFRAGETLNYRVTWASFSEAASVQLSVPEKRDLLGWSTWHFRASAHTLSPVRTLFAIDDEFDSYTDAATLETRQFETYLNELGKKRDQTYHFIPQGQSPKEGVPATIVLPGTRDPLGALFALRTVDWQKTRELRAPVYDGAHMYEMRARLESAADTISAGEKNLSASKISIRLFQNEKEVPGMNFTVWIANDAARTPALLQAELPLGSIRVEWNSPGK